MIFDTVALLRVLKSLMNLSRSRMRPDVAYFVRKLPHVGRVRKLQRKVRLSIQKLFQFLFFFEIFNLQDLHTFAPLQTQKVSRFSFKSFAFTQRIITLGSAKQPLKLKLF